MKIEQKIWAAGLCLAGLLAASSAPATVVITFNENGVTSATGGTDPYTSQGVQSDALPTGSLGGYPIPSPANGSTLDFTAPGNLYGSPPSGSSYFPQYGWLAIYAPGGVHGTTAGLLDLIHWDNSDGNGAGQQMFWYSLEGSGNLADHWLSSSFVNTVLGSHWLVSATENALGLATYTPTSLDNPGDVVYYPPAGQTAAPVTSQYTFDFQSSVAPVPEPTTVIAGALLLLPFGAGLLRVIRKPRAV